MCSCFYDLIDSAFDTVEFCVLLEELFHAGVKGKYWRLIQQWYCDLMSQAKLDNLLSKPFNISRGICQGFVLSPSTLRSFLGPLPMLMTFRRAVLLILRMLLSQSSVLILSPSPGAFVSVQKHVPSSSVSIDETCLPASVLVSGRILLPPAKSMLLNRFIKHMLSSPQSTGCLHDLLNPLSSCSIVECCVFPVLMYGSESWVLNTAFMRTLESFQAELVKHILKLPKFTSNNIPLLVLNWPSMCARILCNKLSILPTASLSSQLFNSIAASDVTSMSSANSLSQNFSTEFTSEVLTERPEGMCC